MGTMNVYLGGAAKLAAALAAERRPSGLARPRRAEERAPAPARRDRGRRDGDARGAHRRPLEHRRARPLDLGLLRRRLRPRARLGGADPARRGSRACAAVALALTACRRRRSRPCTCSCRRDRLARAGAPQIIRRCAGCARQMDTSSSRAPVALGVFLLRRLGGRDDGRPERRRRRRRARRLRASTSTPTAGSRPAPSTTSSPHRRSSPRVAVAAERIVRNAPSIAVEAPWNTLTRVLWLALVAAGRSRSPLATAACGPAGGRARTHGALGARRGGVARAESVPWSAGQLDRARLRGRD